MALFFRALNLGHVPGGDDRNCGECGSGGDDALPVAEGRAKSKGKAKAKTGGESQTKKHARRRKECEVMKPR